MMVFVCAQHSHRRVRCRSFVFHSIPFQLMDAHFERVIFSGHSRLRLSFKIVFVHLSRIFSSVTMGHGGMSCGLKTIRFLMVLFNILFFVSSCSSLFSHLSRLD